MLKGTSLLYSGGGEDGLYPEGVIIDRDTSTKGTRQNHNNGNKLVPLRTFNKVLNKQKVQAKPVPLVIYDPT